MKSLKQISTDSLVTPMQRALALARQALGTTSPNPAVGAVVVKEGAVIGEGFTLPTGQRHAEIGALEQAGAAAQGAELYTTLEPCCHFGRTPPCTDAIIAAGVKTVHLAIIDPNPQVAGRGCAQLQAAGIQVVVEDTQGAQELYEGFAKHIQSGIPFLTAKFAMSLDGKIATHTGDSKWVTGAASRRVVQEMRRECDAVLVGINTVLADDPQLTARDEGGSPLPQQPLRVVLDSQCRTPPDATMLVEPGNTLIVTSQNASPARIAELADRGAQVLPVPLNEQGRVDLPEVMAELGRRDVVNLLVEGGGIVLGSLFDAGLVDKVYAFLAPKIIGGEAAPTPVGGTGAPIMSQSFQLERTRWEQIGEDWLIVGYPVRGHPVRRS